MRPGIGCSAIFKYKADRPQRDQEERQHTEQNPEKRTKWLAGAVIKDRSETANQKVQQQISKAERNNQKETTRDTCRGSARLLTRGLIIQAEKGGQIMGILG
jgi:UDP-N-acetylglucosamine:LPS N-acetylglucosamine transferase